MDDDRELELLREPQVLLEEPRLRLARRVVAVVIEPRLAHRHGTIVHEQLAELVQPLRVGRVGIVRMNAERRVHTRLPRRQGRAPPCTSRRPCPP